MHLYLTIVHVAYLLIYVLKVGDQRPFGANVIYNAPTINKIYLLLLFLTLTETW